MGPEEPATALEPCYATVLIDSIPVAGDRAYTYRVPDELRARLRPGAAVSVPFGARARADGIVVAFPAPPPPTPDRDIRAIVADSLLPPALETLLAWLADYYCCPLGQVYQTALPRGLLSGAVREKTQLGVTVAGGLASPLSKRQLEVLDVLAAAGGQMTLQALLAAAQTTPALLRAMERSGALAIGPMPQRRRPPLPAATLGTPPEPTPEQLAAIAAIDAAAPGDVFLLHGVTGSGKTEVYLRAIAATLGRGEQALVLVPEIALTPQTVSRFRARFGDRIAVLHSALGEGERFDEWHRLRSGEALVGIGARSAVFAPLERLGLIVLDEEHESSYKQDAAPRYHARTVALQRAALEGARVVLGSATPAIESYHAACSGQYRLLSLARRINDRPLPPVAVVDMRAELADGHRSIFSRALVDALTKTVERREQAILLINRRGYASFVLCRRCGEAVRCPNCSVALTYHRAGEALRCHYCDHREPVPGRCPACQSPYIKHFGAGTQQVAEAVAAQWPTARYLRLDRDTAARKDAHRQILEAFARGDADILIGTQMVAKGLDLPRVTLVGVMAADAALNLPDFRSSERTFQLLTQVAGRAGRADLAGQVVIQAYAPDHPSVKLAQAHDYAAFYAQELGDRAELAYPPFGSLVNLVISAEDPAAAWGHGEAIALRLQRDPSLQVLGPAEATLYRLRGRFRVRLLVKSPELAPLRRGVREAVQATGRPAGVRVAIDIEPVTLL